MTYFLAPALVTLRDEANKAFPKRDKASDGWIGDPSHAARVSDHNPCWACPGRSEGIVRALDLDISPDGRADADLRTRLLEAAIGDPRVWYVISNGKIYSRTHGWVARVYTGSNPHTQHVHVSLNGANGVPGDPGNFDTSTWGLVKGSTPPDKDPTLPAVSLSAVVHAARFPRREVHPVAVRRVQRALNVKVRAGLDVDGIYGPATRAAVAAFQRRQGWTGQDADGILGRDSGTRLGRNRFRLVR